MADITKGQVFIMYFWDEPLKKQDLVESFEDKRRNRTMDREPLHLEPGGKVVFWYKIQNWTVPLPYGNNSSELELDQFSDWRQRRFTTCELAEGRTDRRTFRTHNGFFFIFVNKQKCTVCSKMMLKNFKFQYLLIAQLPLKYKFSRKFRTLRDEWSWEKTNCKSHILYENFTWWILKNKMLRLSPFY